MADTPIYNVFTLKLKTIKGTANFCKQAKVCLINTKIDLPKYLGLFHLQ